MKKDEKFSIKLKVKTPFGMLVAEPAKDPEYPGVWITMVDDKGNENTLALVETKDLKNGEGYIRLLAYTDPDTEDYTHELFFQGRN